MMTRLEQETYEVVGHCLPRIADALESIAKTLMTLRCDATQNVETDYKVFVSGLKPREGNDV